MKTLNLHCDYIKFKALKKALKKIDEIAPSQNLEGESKDCLVVLIAVEKTDNKTETVEKLVKNVKDISSQVKAENIVLYPYAHLSRNLGSPELAVEILDLTEKRLIDFNVIKAPFGYYKTFELKVKGHPLSELSREIVIEGNEEEEQELSSDERERMWKKMKKVKMQAPRGKNDLKSNVELARDLDLYVVNEIVGPGLPLLTPKGATIKREIERFAVDEEIRRGYEHTSTPIMAKSDLYKISGHWQHYRKDMFVLNIEGQDYALRPMTCPFQFVLFNRKPRSYRDLPKKYGEMSTLYRKEQSGELRGLTRLWQFTLADGHIICTPGQLEEEFGKVVDLVKYIMETFGIEVWYRFSKWDPKNKKNKYIENPKAWENSEKSMKKILDNMKLEYVEADDEAAFYGPKLDLQYKDVYGKEDTLITIQIDFALPEKFGLLYLDKDGKEKRPMVIHRSSTGATERIISYLLEKTQGNLPLWLSPVQARVLTMNDDSKDYGKEVKEKLQAANIRTELDDANESMGKKARNAIVEKVFYLVTVGEKEKKEGKVAVRKRGSKDIITMTVDEFISKTSEEIKTRKR
jgi:threonyl-tRNA synthetase